LRLFCCGGGLVVGSGEQVFLLGVQTHYPIPGDWSTAGSFLLMREYFV
jgi:hypothetical protein